MALSATSSEFTERFDAVVARLPIAGFDVTVAFSGGIDSTLLLHQLHRSGAPASLEAIHIDHGLHDDSADWSAHCAEVAAGLGIECVNHRVPVRAGPGQSLEAVAREMRYGALAEAIGAGEVVVTAHHADDQLETVLLRLLRGSGVRGLTAIHAVGPLGEGRLVRPLLEFTRAEIEAEARRLGLRWLEDPSNVDERFDRNFLRARVLPVIRERWPRSGITAARLARQMAEAERVLADVAAADLAAADLVAADLVAADLAAADLAAADELERIPVDLLLGLPEHRRNNALRHAIRRVDLPLPNATQLAELTHALDARADAEVEVRWPGAQARIYRRMLYLMVPAAAAEAPERARLVACTPLALGNGELSLVATDEAYGIPDRWARSGLDVKFRTGGERFRPQGSRQHKSLKQWFQEAGIVPWMRSAVPLIYHDGELVAIADLCLAADLPQGTADGPFWRPVWRGHSRLR